MIHIIIPVHNRLSNTVECLRSLDLQDYQEFLIYVIDDGSTDGTAEHLREMFPHVRVINGDGDLWWTGAVRKGVEVVLSGGTAEGDHIMTLNNDVELLSDTLVNLHNFALNNKKSLVNALSLDSKDRDTVVTSGNRMISWVLNISVHPLHNQSYRSIDKNAIEVDMLNGRCVLYPVDVFKDIGNFDDERFPHYGGDNEFTLRAKRHGWNLFILPSAVIFLDQETTGLNPLSAKLTIREIAKSFFTLKSPYNLMIRTRFAWRCCPWYALPTYIPIMYLKIFIQTILGNIYFRLNRKKPL